MTCSVLELLLVDHALFSGTFEANIKNNKSSEFRHGRTDTITKTNEPLMPALAFWINSSKFKITH